MRPQDNEIKKFVNKKGDKVFSDLSVDNYDEIQVLKETKADKTELNDYKYETDTKINSLENITTELSEEIDNLELNKADKSNVYTKQETDEFLATKQEKGDYATNSDVNQKYNELINDIDELNTVVDSNYSTLDTKINTTSQTINQRITDVADEINQTIEENVVALQQEDSALQNQINAHSQNITGLDSRITSNSNAITQEITNRQNSDDILQDQIDNLKARGRFLSLWNAATGLPKSTPQTSPYIYNTGDYFIVGVVGDVNYRPTGTQYVIGQASTEVETEELTTDDVYYFDGTTWHLQVNHGKTVSFENLAGEPEDNTALRNALNSKQDELVAGDNITIEGNIISATGSASGASWGNITGTLSDQTDLNNALSDKQDVISNLSTIESNAQAGKNASDTIATYGDIVAHNADEFQPIGDYATNTDLTQRLATKQDTLISGTNIKTLNNESLLGEGNIDITSAQWGNITGNIEDQTDLKNSLQNVREVAEGKTKSYVVSYADNPLFNSQDDEVVLQTTFIDINGVVHDIEELKLGDNIFVQETDVPDRWCSQPSRGGSILPEEYTQLEYIESTGTQYIDTGYILTSKNVRYILDYMFLNNPQGTTLFGSTNSSSSNNKWSGTLYNVNNVSQYFVAGSSNNLGTRNIATNTRYNVDLQFMDNNSWSYSRNSDVITGTYSGSIQTDVSIALLADKFSNGIFNEVSKSVRIYEFKIYDNNILSLLFVPAKRKTDGIIGMYDLVSNTFFTNSGTGSFVAGPVIEKSVIFYKLETSKVDLTSYATKTEVDLKQNITDNSLVTTNKTVVGAVNELDAKIKDIQLYKFPNAIIIGQPTINNGQISGFSQQNYLTLPFLFDVGDRAFEFNYAFRTGDNVTTAQNLFGSNYCIASYIQNGKLTVRVSSNGTSWDVVSLETSLNVLANTVYYIKIAFNKLNYTISASTDGTTYNQIGYVVNTKKPIAGNVFIGIGNNQNNPFLGVINLNRWDIRLNNSIIWEGMDDVGLATRADISLSNLDEQGEARFEAKQDVISDLDDIRSNATIGSELAPQVAINTQRIEDLTVAKFPNVVIVGTPHIEGGQVSNYSDTNYLQFPFVDISRGQPFDIYFSFTTGTNITTQQNILDSHFGIALAIQNGKGIMALSSNGSNWDIGTATGTNTLLPNTTYYVKYSWTGTAYSAALSTDDQIYIPDMNLISSLSPYKTTIFIGGSPNLFGSGTAHPFGGTINFNKSKVVVNGITVWEGMADVGLASRANVSLNNLDEIGEARFSDLQDAINTKQPIGDYATNSDLTVHTGNTTIHVTASDKIAWSQKQNAISDLDTIRDGASKGAEALSGLATEHQERILVDGQLSDAIASKQAIITDLGTIRDGASKGATAIQQSQLEAYHDSTKQDTLVSGTNIKTINGESVLGSGDLEIEASSIEPLTQEEYDRRKEAGELDENKYYSTPSDITLQMLEAIYPVGSLYLTTASNCPLATLGIGVWQLVANDRVLQGAGNRGAVGTTINESLPNITGTMLLHAGEQANIIQSVTGAISGSGGSTTKYRTTGSLTANSGASSYGALDFNASRSSSTYQDNAPVQQNAYLINVYRRIS